MRESFVLTEKYRPQKVEDCILPTRLKKPFQHYVDTKKVPSMLLFGPPGTGKTTIAMAMCDEIGLTWLKVNASDERGIDVLRTKIKSFASTNSLSGKRKVVIMDEADHITADAQAALRGMIEEFEKNCSFIFTCNYKAKIIEAIHSRCVNVNFSLTQDEKEEMGAAFYKRVISILKTEGIAYESDAVIKIILRYFPDYRRTLNELQHLAQFGKIDAAALGNLTDITDVGSVYGMLKDKDFAAIRKWLAANSDIDTETLYRRLYDALNTFVAKQSIPTAIVTLAKYQYQAAFCADKEINTLACLTELMLECDYV